MGSTLHPNVAALTGLLIWYGVFALLDAKDRHRWLRPLLPLLAGALSFRLLGSYLSFVHPLLHPHLQSLLGDHTLLRFIIDVGLREESIKLLLALPILLWLTRHSTPTATPASALLAAALVGVGFATVENRAFFTAHHQPPLLVGRVFSTTLLHAAATGLCGAALFRALAGSRSHPWARVAATLLIIATAHGLYDWAPASGLPWLHLGGTSWLSQAIVLTLIASLLSTYRRLYPAAPQARAAALWLLCGTLLQYTLALGLTWARWHTLPALAISARECALFLPLVLVTALFLLLPTRFPSTSATPHH